MSASPSPEPETALLHRQLALANLKLQYSALVAQCASLDSSDAIRQLNIKHVVHTDTLLSRQSARTALLESSAGEQVLRLSEELSDAKSLVSELQEKVGELEAGVREAEKMVKEQGERSRQLEGDLRKEQQRLGEAQERLGEVNRLLREANEFVKEKEEELDKVKRAGGKDGKELAELREENESLKSEVGKLKREKDTLQSENKSLSDVSTRANNLLAEKIALTHQVSHLNTELESLRTISETSKAHLAEKLSLQQRVTHMEFELENCKNVISRLKENTTAASAAEAQLRQELADAKAEIAREVKARERVELESARMKEGWVQKEKVLKGKVESGKKMIKELKDTVEEAKKGGKRKAGVAQLTMEDLESTVKKPRTKGPKPSVSDFSMTPFFKKVAQPVGKFKGQGGKKALGDETGEEEVDEIEDDDDDDVEMTGNGAAATAGVASDNSNNDGDENPNRNDVLEEPADTPDSPPKQQKPKAKQTRKKKVAATTTDTTATAGGNSNNTPTQTQPQPPEAPAPAPAVKPKKLTAKEKRAQAAAAKLIPVAIPTSQPTKILLAGANKKPPPVKKDPPTSTSTTTSAVTAAAATLTSTSTSVAGDLKKPRTILDDAFDTETQDLPLLEEIISSVKPVSIPSANSVPANDDSTTSQGKKGAKEKGGSSSGGVKLARSLFEDKDGSGRIEFDLEKVGGELLGGAVGAGGAAGAAEMVVRREFSPRKKRPKGVGVKVGVRKEKE